ncbi:hypothetical protein LWI28_013845 [Acer negundo]|uniref:Partial AB-hydrolase lipase domain-containing protein n=1 Tax=Acer negundo TaxID=4023 RepID=A0AAD5NRF0_ACENE|nr:hypothetical protein LWI28_013845 [Acer negundo]
MQRLRSRGTSLFGSIAAPQIKKKAVNTWGAVQDTYFSTKDIFERHRVVFTVGTSIASVATAWIGYSIRYHHQSKVDQRLESIEKALKDNSQLGHAEVKKLVDPGSSAAATMATIGTTLVIGYGLGWRGGRWYATRKFRREQMKLLGQIKPKRWQLAKINPIGWQFQFLRRPLTRSRVSESSSTKTSEKTLKDSSTAHNPVKIHQSLILLSGSAVASSQLFPHKAQDGTDALAAATDDGICITLVKTQGYACEEHTVTTQDGYILSMQRILVGGSGRVPGKKPPVLLQHGLLSDAATWLLLPSDQALAFVLADNGFDSYWNWSWDELVTYELPAMFRYVYEKTGQKLHYVGHSQGTLIALAALSKDKTLLNMWSSASLLAPLAYAGKMTSQVTRAAAEDVIANVPYWLDVQEFDPFGMAAIQLILDACKKSGVDCSDLQSATAGHNCCLNPSSSAAMLFHGEPSSTKNIIHFSQMVTKGTFVMYDYNDENENRKFYGQPTPPAYELENIPNDFPLYLFHGGADALCDVQDVQLLLDGIKYHNRNNLLVKSVVGTRTKLFSVSGVTKTSGEGDAKAALSPAGIDDGICGSMVETQSYACEEHMVTTQDGYILSMQRIPSGRSGETGNKPPVLLQHGLLMDAITWLLLPPEQSLAFLLADNGYDVWLANTRGTKYSRGHVSLSPDDSIYWDWTWDELVVYDLPATVQYVHDQTGQKLHYVGHSLGTLIALASFSEDQLMNNLRSAALLSPIAYVGQVTSPLARNAAENFLAEGLYRLGLDEFDPKGEAVIKLLKAICAKPGVDCTNLLTSFTVIRTGTITMYDYDDEGENMRHYGQANPPAYNMTSIPNDFPLFLGYGGADALSDVNDVKLLLDSLKDHDGDKLVTLYRDDYAHADYVMAENAKQVVYDPLMAFFKLQ